jgi:small subunit ribosomal protein S15
MRINKEDKTKIITEYHRHDNDTGSPEVQVAILSHRIKQLTEHLKLHKHDESSRRGLIKLVGKRRRHLAYLKREDPSTYLSLTESLSIRRK